MKSKLFIFLFLPAVLFGQQFSSSKFGGTVGLFFTMGTHKHSYGINLKAYYADYFYQLNVGNSFTWNAYSFGSRKKFFESRTSVGALLLADKRKETIDFELDGLNHQTQANYGIGYNYLIYWDNAKTSQLSGGWSMHIKNFSMKFENDVFGGQAKDRFRTGHLTASYLYNQFKWTLGLSMWTGETAGSNWVKMPMDNCPSGFRYLDELPFGKTSHGILYGGMTTSLPYGNTAHFRVGVDSENVRHFFQNRLTHDLILLPKSIERNTPHYPRLDQYGCPTFEKDSVRKDRFYMQFGLNDNWGN